MVRRCFLLYHLEKNAVVCDVFFKLGEFLTCACVADRDLESGVFMCVGGFCWAFCPCGCLSACCVSGVCVNVSGCAFDPLHVSNLCVSSVHTVDCDILAVRAR